MSSGVDTFLQLRASDCQVNSDDPLIFLYKKNGITKSKAFSSWGAYSREITLAHFDWALLLNSVDSIKLQKPQPSYYGAVIEGDTTWHLTDGLVKQIWTFELCYGPEKVHWTTNEAERTANPSMEKTKVSDYVFGETYHKMKEGAYGQRAYNRVLVVERKEH